MSQDLNQLKEEVLQYLKSHNFSVFHGAGRQGDVPSIHWDAERYPDYRQFLEVAREAEAKIVCLSVRSLTARMLDSTLLELDDADLPQEMEQDMRRRLGQLKDFEGFTSAVELSFDFQRRLYLFVQRAPWYLEFLTIASAIDSALELDEEFDDDDNEPPPRGGYYSNN